MTEFIEGYDGEPCLHLGCGTVCRQPIEIPPDPSTAYDLRIEDHDGGLWELTQRLKRLNDELGAYGFGAGLIDTRTGRTVSLAHFVTLVDDTTPSPWEDPGGPAGRSRGARD